jgi:hypothetical protein
MNIHFIMTDASVAHFLRVIDIIVVHRPVHRTASRWFWSVFVTLMRKQTVTQMRMTEAPFSRSTRRLGLRAFRCLTLTYVRLGVY